MAKVLAGITMSIDGRIAGPDDGPAKGLGDTGERLHHWVFGGPWTYGDEARSEPTGEEAAVERALQAAAGKDVSVMGGADVIRQALEAGLVDELTIIIAPVILGAGKQLFDGFTRSLDLEHLGIRQSPYATFIDYRIR